MRKMQNTNVCKKHTTAARHTTRTITTTNRRDRWRGHIIAELDRVETRRLDCYIPPEWLAEVYGRPAEDVVLAALCEDRGVDVENPTPEQVCNLDVDDRIESKASIRLRNQHEKRVVGSFFYHFMGLPVGYLQRLNSDERRDFFLKFYRKGDVGMKKSIERAVLASIGKEVAA